MQNLEKFLIRSLFLLLFLTFVVLSTLNFQLLNKNYLFSVFSKHQIYQKIPISLANSLRNDPNLRAEEKLGYSIILKSVSPNVVEKIVKSNLSSTLDYIHGKNNDLEISIPAGQLGLGGEDLSWSLLQNTDPESRQQLSFIHGFGNTVFIIWLVNLALLGVLFILYGEVIKSKYFLGGNSLIIPAGAMLFLLGSVLKLSSLGVVKSFPVSQEPSQALLSILLSSLLSEIFLTWIITGALIIILGMILRVADIKIRTGRLSLL